MPITEQRREYARKRRERFRAAGLCPYDGRPRMPDRSTCQQCYEMVRKSLDLKRQARPKQFCKLCGDVEIKSPYRYCPDCRKAVDRELRRARYARRLAGGGCTRCGHERAPGKLRCQRCIDRERDQRKRHRPISIWCDDCHEQPRDGGRHRCAECWRRNRRDKQRLRDRQVRAMRDESGLCLRCGLAPKGRTTLCDACANRNRDSQAKFRSVRAARGLCVRCGKVESAEGKWCQACAARALESYHMRKTQPVTMTEAWWWTQAERWGLDNVPTDIQPRHRRWLLECRPHPTDEDVMARMPDRARGQYKRWIEDGRKPFAAEAVWDSIRKAAPK